MTSFVLEQLALVPHAGCVRGTVIHVFKLKPNPWRPHCCCIILPFKEISCVVVKALHSKMFANVSGKLCLRGPDEGVLNIGSQSEYQILILQRLLRTHSTELEENHVTVGAQRGQPVSRIQLW